MQLHLYNTLARQKEAFSPLDGKKVRFYSCGPTVYNTVHIGNLRAFLFADTLYRWLAYGHDYEVEWVMNITDVDDKTIRDSQVAYPQLDPMEALIKFTRMYEAKFFEDLETLHIEHDSFTSLPRATESVAEMQELIRKIADNGIAYPKDGSVYFSLEKYLQHHPYGTLVNLDLKSLQTGTRTLCDEIEKENIQDFVLWKGQKSGEPAWDFDYFGTNLPGRPGWHIECSAMSKAAFSDLPFDIHSGGIDLCFPHHEDEIAQSVAGYGTQPVRYWVHNEHLMVEGKKMSKSLGNFYALADLMQKGHSPDAIRFFLASNHYRTKLNLSEQSLRSSAQCLKKIRNRLRNLSSPSANSDIPISDLPHWTAFATAMNDDLNTPKAVAVLFQALDTVDDAPDVSFTFFRRVESVFGVQLLPTSTSIPDEVISLAEERKIAKSQKDFDTADMLRQQIVEHGYDVRDIADGYEIVPHGV